MSYHEVLGYLLGGYITVAVFAAGAFGCVAWWLPDDRWPETVSWRKTR